MCRAEHGSEYNNLQHFTSFIDVYASGWMFLDVLIPSESGFHKKPPLPHCFTGAAFGASIKTNLLACFRKSPIARPTYTTLLAAFDLDRVR